MKKARFEFIEEHRDEFSVRAMCCVLGVTRQDHCQWLARPRLALAFVLAC